MRQAFIMFCIFSSCLRLFLWQIKQNVESFVWLGGQVCEGAELRALLTWLRHHIYQLQAHMEVTSGKSAGRKQVASSAATQGSGPTSQTSLPRQSALPWPPFFFPFDLEFILAELYWEKEKCWVWSTGRLYPGLPQSVTVKRTGSCSLHPLAS